MDYNLTRKRNRQAESFWATYTQKSKVAFFCSLEIFFSMFGLGVNLVEGKKLNNFCNQIKTYSTITVSFFSLTQQSKCQDREMTLLQLLYLQGTGSILISNDWQKSLFFSLTSKLEYFL